MPLIVLTYPGHFLLSALTIKSYLKYHTPTEIIVVADDVSSQAWPTYIKDCEQLYKTQVIPVSNIPQAVEFGGNGWVRQQIIKLHLDQVLEFDSWFFTDGDIVFLHAVNPTDIPYSVPYFGEQTQKQNEYVANLLGIELPGIINNGQQVCVSNPAFRTMEKLTLQQLRQHIEIKHNQSIALLHQPYLNSNSICVSEWELIENFKQHIMGKELTLVKYAPHDIANTEANLNFFSHQFLTCYSTDKTFGQEWFVKQDLVVSDNIWQILSNINR